MFLTQGQLAADVDAQQRFVAIELCDQLVGATT